MFCQSTFLICSSNQTMWELGPNKVCNCRNTELEVQLTTTQKEGRMEQEQVNKLQHHLQEVGIYMFTTSIYFSANS